MIVHNSPDMTQDTVGVTTVAFSKNPVLVEELRRAPFKRIKINAKGRRLTRVELVEMLHDCDAAIVGLDRIDGPLLKKTPRMKLISKYGVGLDNIVSDQCRMHAVTVCHTAGVNKRSVAELSLSFMLTLLHNVHITSALLRQGEWLKHGGRQLAGRTVGIVGLGHVGTELVRLLRPFGCTILGNDITDRRRFCRENGVLPASKDDIFKRSDIVTIHTPLTPRTRHLIDSRTLSRMKPTALIINTSRGGVVNEADLKAALIKGRIAGAALDVYEEEPPHDMELLRIPNLIATPHIAGNTEEAVVAMGRAAIANLLTFYRAPLMAQDVLQPLS